MTNEPLFHRGEAVNVDGKGAGRVTWDTDDMCGVEMDDPRMGTISVAKSQVSTR